MVDAARKDGIYLVVREGYRTYEEQQKILDDKIKAYKNCGVCIPFIATII